MDVGNPSLSGNSRKKREEEPGHTFPQLLAEGEGILRKAEGEGRKCFWLTPPIGKSTFLL